ncbi:MAG: glycosyltransferase family 2 protein [Lachnospiraceae bacterium]|nr:glycosyltransferase family 2 protein [Lachnospiraceae bacterium]
MNSFDKISIIIPCYNVEKYIDRCLQSVIDQTYPAECMEIICVNDASTDNTLDLLKAWEQRYPDNICVVDCEVNGRQGRARNIGIEYATGEWIAFIDSDDWIEKDYLSSMLDASEGCEIVCCRLGRDSSDSLSYFEKPQTGQADRELVFDNDDKRREMLVLATLSFSAYCKLIRKSFLVENSLFFPEGLAYEDIYWGTLIPYYVSKVRFVEKALYHYYVNPGSTVLAGDAGYHPDMLTVNLMVQEELRRRGLFQKYRDEIEYNFLYTCYFAFLKVLALRYSKPEYSLYRLLREITLEAVPDWHNNRYIRNGDIKEFHLILLELLDKDIDKTAFLQVLEAIRKAGI